MLHFAHFKTSNELGELKKLRENLSQKKVKLTCT